MIYTSILELMIWGTLSWYLFNGKKTTPLMYFIMMTCIVSFIAAGLVVFVYHFHMIE